MLYKLLAFFSCCVQYCSLGFWGVNTAITGREGGMKVQSKIVIILKSLRLERTMSSSDAAKGVKAYGKSWVVLLGKRRKRRGI